MVAILIAVLSDTEKHKPIHQPIMRDIGMADYERDYTKTTEE